MIKKNNSDKLIIDYDDAITIFCGESKFCSVSSIHLSGGAPL